MKNEIEFYIEDETVTRRQRDGAERFIRFAMGWIFVRPRRWFFSRMVMRGSHVIQWLPMRDDCWNCWILPNIHWWMLDRTIFQFFKWLHYEAWRPFCDWTGGYRRTMPWIARAIKRIGDTTAGYAIHGGECFHCGHPEGCQVELSEDGTGVFFKLEKTWVEGTQNGTDYRFRGKTICPMCGYGATYEDGSL